MPSAFVQLHSGVKSLPAAYSQKLSLNNKEQWHVPVCLHIRVYGRFSVLTCHKTNTQKQKIACCIFMFGWWSPCMGHGLWRDHTCDVTLLHPTLGQFETSWGPNTKLQIQKILCHVTMRRSREVYSACCPRLFQFHGNDFLRCLFVKDLFLFSQLWLWSCPEKSTQKANKVCKSYILETPMIIWEHKRQ